MRRRSIPGVFGVVSAGLGVAAVCGACASAPSALPRVGSAASALDGYDQCARVLEGDLFNKIMSTEGRAQAASSRVWSTLLIVNEDEAYNRYRNYYHETQGWTGSGGFKYGNILGLEASGGEDRELTRDEFGERYRLMKSYYSQVDFSEHAENSSFLSAHASYIRDPASIDAWRACVMSRQQPGLYAYGERDASGNAGVHVVWSPGDFGGVAPRINITFERPSGYRVVAAENQMIGIGSGKRFAIEAIGADIDKAFDVPVNGEMRHSVTGELLGSMSAVAKIPPKEPNWIKRPNCIWAPSGLVSFWKGDGNADDQLGAHPGDLVNGTGIGSGKVGQAFSLNGTSHVRAAAAGFPTGSADRSIELWVWIDAFVAGEAFFAGYGDFGAFGQTYHLGASGTTLFFSQWGGSIGGPSLSTNTWYHLAVTNVGDLVTLYLNGDPVGTARLTMVTPAGTPFYIGRIPEDDFRRLQGRVDEVSVYNRALSAAEVRSIYLAGANGKCASGPGPGGP